VAFQRKKPAAIGVKAALTGGIAWSSKTSMRAGAGTISLPPFCHAYRNVVLGTVMLAKLTPSNVEEITAPAAIERALLIYQQLKERDSSVLSQARKIVTQHIYGMVDRGERNEQRLTVAGLAHLKAVERDHAIKSAWDGATKKRPRQGKGGFSKKVRRCNEEPAIEV
jgi:hypothetical protein